MTDEFDPKERPTKPDIGHICPDCSGEGAKLTDISEVPGKERWVRRSCSTCWGKKRVTSEQLARYLALK